MRTTNQSGLDQGKTSVVLSILAVPRSKDNRIAEIMQDGTVKVHITAPPLEGKANKALIQLLSEFFGLSKAQIKIIRGENSRRKAIAITGINLGDVNERLAELREKG